jgi:hypothetical protein
MRHPPRQDCPCPGHITDYVERLASFGAQKATVASVDEVKSAQQRVFILSLHFEADRSRDRKEAASPSVCSNASCDRIQRALSKGNGKIVARIWKGSARWWNLNTNDASGARRGVGNIARSEIAGYRMARAAISASHASLACTTSSENDMVIIPDVIYFSCDYRGDKANNVETVEHRHEEEEEEDPWAILSYVGDESLYFQRNDSISSPICSSPWVCDGQYAKDMVKIRHEFGCDEPHPRHGRVKEDQALNYAMQVMDSVVFPLQGAFFSSTDDGRNCNKMSEEEEDLTVLGKPGNLKPKPFRFMDMVAIYRDAAKKISDSMQVPDAIDPKVGALIAALNICIENLNNEAKSCPFLSDNGELLPASLCHMDLQPQNLILRRHKGEEYDANEVPFVSSVLDWEEACYADPRFEVLLMARKVCANREQADLLWKHYSHRLERKHNLIVGPIDPWLKLETVHSITTLLLQSMDLVGGGRNPWESKPDLLGKIVREFARLKAIGWDLAI